MDLSAGITMLRLFCWYVCVEIARLALLYFERVSLLCCDCCVEIVTLRFSCWAKYVHIVMLRRLCWHYYFDCTEIDMLRFLCRDGYVEIVCWNCFDEIVMLRLVFWHFFVVFRRLCWDCDAKVLYDGTVTLGLLCSVCYDEIAALKLLRFSYV